METGNSLKQIVNFKDETLSLDLDSVRNYHLSIQLSLNGFSFSILDENRRKYIALVAYSFRRNNSSKQAIDFFDSIVTNESLKKNFHSVTITWNDNKSVLVPKALFDKNKLPEFLKYNAELNEKDSLAFEFLKNCDAYNVYGLPSDVIAWINANFKDAKVYHYSTMLVEHLLNLYKNVVDAPVLFVDMKEFSFDVVVIKKGELLYCNYFDYQSPEDFVYYILFLCEQLILNPENIQFKMLGEIEINSTLHALLKKYVRNIDLIERNENIGYSYRINELPGHFYYMLLNQYSG